MPLMNSFYGGRRGASFVIVKNYVDVLSMTKDFSLGNDFTEVKFDEYVLINNPRKNHPDNGKIFRRGYDYNSNRTLSSVTLLYKKVTNGNEGESWVRYEPNELNEEVYKGLSSQNNKFEIESVPAYGAEYVGCIVGPAGKAPLLSIGSYEQAYDKNADAGLETRKGQGSYSPNGNNPGLIPGKDGNEYHDSIEWAYASIRNDNYGDDTQAFIGFKFPYLVTEMQASQVEPYDNNGNIADMSNISRVLGENETIGTHPYYNKWHLNIPKGIKGDTVYNLKITTFEDFQQGYIPLEGDEIVEQESSENENSDEKVLPLYRLEKVFDSELNKKVWEVKQLLGSTIDFNFFINRYSINQEDIRENEEEYSIRKLFNKLKDKQILVYEIVNYDNKQEGQKKYYFLGDYNQIKKVKLANDGTITVSFTNQDDKVLEEKLKWIKDINLFAGNWEDKTKDDGQLDYQLDEQGNYIYQTNEDGSYVYLSKENGEPIYEDINGEPVYEETENTQYRQDENGERVQARKRKVKQVWKPLKNTSNISEENQQIQGQIQNGTLVIHYNDEDVIYTIPWVDKIVYDEEDGFLKYKLAGQDETYPIGAFHGIDTIRQTDNELQIIYNYKREGQQVVQSFPLKSISDVVFLEEDNQFFIFARGDDGKILYNADHKPLYRTFSQNEEGQQIFTDNPQEDPNARTQTLTGIVVFYTNGDHELITGQRKWKDTSEGDEQLEEVGGGFNFLEEFGFTTQTIDDSTVINGIEYKTLKDEEKQVADIIYPVKMYYNQNTGQISYLNSKNTSVDVGTLPIVQSIDIGENLDVYVELSNPANYFKTIDSTHLSNDSAHPYVPTTGPYWYKIGNLIQEGLTFAGVRRVFTYDQLKEAVLGGISDSTEIYNTWTKWENQEDVLINTDTIIQTLNALYPDGTNQIRNTIINSEEQSTGSEEQGTENEETSSEEEASVTEDNSTNSAFLFVAVKQNSTSPSDFYAYSYDNTKNSNIDELNNSEETIIVGTWFYVGSIGDLGNPDSIFKIVESRNSEDSSSPALTFRTPSDIYSIEPGSLNLSNPMREIKDGAGYKTTIKMNSKLSGSQTITVTMEDDTNVIATFNSGSGFPYVVNIPPKDENNRGVYGPIKFVKV